MTAPKVGCHARIREAKIANYTAHYGRIGKDDVFIVESVDNARARGCVSQTAGARRIPVWRGDVKPHPRCEYCDEEGHTRSAATKTNCRALREKVA